LIFWNV